MATESLPHLTDCYPDFPTWADRVCVYDTLYVAKKNWHCNETIMCKAGRRPYGPGPAISLRHTSNIAFSLAPRIERVGNFRTEGRTVIRKRVLTNRPLNAAGACVRCQALLCVCHRANNMRVGLACSRPMYAYPRVIRTPTTADVVMIMKA